MPTRYELEELRGIVRDAGLRATPSRIAVLGLLRAAIQPASHSDVTNRLGDHGWDPATLYRNLTDFVAAGLARRVDVGDHVWRFELIRAEHTTAHPHFVCTECGAVECMPKVELAFSGATTPKAVRRHSVEVQVRGLCNACI